MIQRVQSIYLLIIALISILILFLNPKYASFTKVDSNKTTQLGFTTTTLADEAGEQNVSKWINSLMLISLGIGSLFAIFLFKKRELQKKLCIYISLIAALLTIFMIMDYNTTKMQFPNTSSYPGVFSVFPVVIIILGFLAWRGVRKDEKLVKSMDRIR